ncbi:MAG: ATP-binding protein, partial [Acidimicrobiia bacterium]
IPDDEVNTIFLPYRRSAKTPRTGSSVGLGLYVSHHLAHAMGGSLAYRRSGGRTEFLLSLPARPDLPLPRPEGVTEKEPGSVCV